MADALVVGYGSDLRSDDAAGRHVAARIAARRLPGVVVVSTPQLLPELVDAIAQARRVVFVDASVEVREVTVESVRPRSSGAPSHHAGPERLLELAESLGLPARPATVVHVPVADLSIGEGLSEHTSAALAAAEAAVLRAVGDDGPERRQRGDAEP